MVDYELQIAAAFGFRDRILGIDSDERGCTLARFNGRKRLERAYWDGYNEADHYCDNCWKWGAELAKRETCGLCIHVHPLCARLQ
jgi:hypothetical protein